MTEQEFSHLDGDGRLRMVDVSGKESTRRVAHASCLVVTDHNDDAWSLSDRGATAVLTSRLAGIQAAKRTSNLIPLCHPLALSQVHLEVARHPRGYEISSTVVTTERTGVEMEALTACSFAALSLVGALMAEDTRAHFEELVLRHKSGGKSGDWGRDVLE